MSSAGAPQYRMKTDALPEEGSGSGRGLGFFTRVLVTKTNS